VADDAEAFPELDDAALAVLEGLRVRRSVAAGEYL